MDKRGQDIEQFEQYLKRRAPGRRTSVDYVSDVRQFAAVCQKPWREVTMQDIDAFVDQQRQKGLSAATIKRRVTAVKVFFDFLAEEAGDLSWPNPVRFKRHVGRQGRRLPRDVSDETVERLWQVITSPRDRAWFALMVRAGLRVGEVVQLKLSDLLAPPTLDRPARLRVCGKGQKERIVLLTADTYAVLQAWLAVRPVGETETIFLNQRGRPLSVNGIEWLLRCYGEQVGVRVTPHQLRHTFARQLTEAGMPITSLSKLLGHTEISTTQIYTAGADPELAQAYQIAMARLAAAPLPVGQAPTKASPQSLQTAPPTHPMAEVSPPPLPNWNTWAPELPSGLRQASLNFVQRRLPGWKPQRRRINALYSLNKLHRYWTWQQSHRPISQPTALGLADLQAYQQACSTAGQSAATIKRTLSEVLALLRDLDEQGQAVDPGLFRLRHLPRPDSLPRHLTAAESQRLEAYVQSRLDSNEPLIQLENACLFILAHTGLRASECIDLQYQNLDLTGKRLVVRLGKGQRDRVVYLSDVAHQALTRYLGGVRRAPAAPLLTKPNGQPVSYNWLYRHIIALGQAAEVTNLTPHRLRHTLATRLLNAGMDITRIQKLLGHEHVNTTMIYARVLDTTVEADYRRAMAEIEGQQMPISTTPELVAGWPAYQTNQLGRIEPVLAELDNSV
jgi:site-specific recombinase XerD